MGDNGKLYVAEDVPPAYKGLIKDADLILPNQFEAEYVPILSWIRRHANGFQEHYPGLRLWILRL